MKDPVWSKIVHIEVHTQLHSATLVLEVMLWLILNIIHFFFGQLDQLYIID